MTDHFHEHEWPDYDWLVKDHKENHHKFVKDSDPGDENDAVSTEREGDSGVSGDEDGAS